MVGLSVPITVGAASTSPARLTPDASNTQALGDLRITLDTNGPLQAGQSAALTFDVTDAAGQTLAPAIELESGLRMNLYVIDEAATTFLAPEPVDRGNLQFSVTFPQPGRYKLWFDFRYQGARQVPFVVEVQ